MATDNETELLAGGNNSRQIQPTPSPNLIWSPGCGPHDGGYFDAHPWFDSDCEDFHSVNGDFGSSRSFTPIADRICSKTDSEAEGEPSPQPVRTPIAENGRDRRPAASRSSSSVKKQLSEFFSESFNRDLESEIVKQQPSSSRNFDNGSPSTSTDRSTRTSPLELTPKPIFSDQETTAGKKKPAGKRACLPSLMRSLSCGGGSSVKARGRLSSTAKGMSQGLNHCYGGKK